MPESESTELKLTDRAAHLIALFTHEDTLVNNWLKTLLAIESALGIGFIYLLKDFFPAPRHHPDWFIALLSFLIPILGVIFAVIIGLIVERELKWQNWFMHSYNELCGWDSSVFPSGDKRRLEPRHQRAGRISSQIRFLCHVLVAVWVVVAILVVFRICAN